MDTEKIMSVEKQIELLDLSLFERIPTQTSPEDRRSLLAVQRMVRTPGSYVYLEIGSHLGGTLLPHYRDPRCHHILSIDKRPPEQPDERGQLYRYENNSTDAMKANLAKADSEVAPGKLHTWDADSSEIDPHDIVPAPGLCFIDGEHTHEAAIRDFLLCEKVSLPEAPILFHDSGVTIDAILEIKKSLQEQGKAHRGLKLGGSVYAILRGKEVESQEKQLRDYVEDEDSFFRSARYYLQRQQREATLADHPLRLMLFRKRNHFLDKAYAVYSSLKQNRT